MVICLELGADLHMAQLMLLPLTVSCFSKIQIGFTFPIPAHPGSPGKRAVKRVCVWGGAYHNLFIPQLTLIKNCVISSVNSIGKAVIWCWELGADSAVANSHACLLVVDISLHLSVDRHVSRVCMGCFYRLRQLWRIRRSLDFDSLAMLIYAVVNSRMD